MSKLLKKSKSSSELPTPKTLNDCLQISHDTLEKVKSLYYQSMNFNSASSVHLCAGDGWKKVNFKEDPGVTWWQKHNEDSPICILKARANVPLSPKVGCLLLMVFN